MPFTLNFSELRMTDVAKVGGKNASLGELFNTMQAKGVGVNLDQLAAAGHAARTMILETPLPLDLCSDVVGSYRELIKRLGGEIELAVRSSASAEDLPEASFSGAAETFLNVRGEAALLRAVHQCFASLLYGSRHQLQGPSRLLAT
jgi:pyruvate, water dikinase